MEKGSELRGKYVVRISVEVAILTLSSKNVKQIIIVECIKTLFFLINFLPNFRSYSSIMPEILNKKKNEKRKSL